METGHLRTGLGAVLAVLCFFTAFAEPVAGRSQDSAEPSLESARPEIEARVRAHRGVAGVAVIDLASGSRFGIRENEVFPSASLVKIPIMIDIFARVEEGAMSMDEPLTFLDIDRTDGSGVLRHLTAPKEVTVWDATFLMISVSDNAATDLLLAKLSPRSINERIQSLGFGSTRLFLPAVNAGPGESPTPNESGAYGLGTTTPSEIAEMLALIYEGEVVSEAASRSMMEILGFQLYEEGLPRYIPDASRVAHKTGSTPTSRNDCGVVLAPQRDFVLCVMTKDNVDQSWGLENEAYVLMGELGAIVYDELNPTDGDRPRQRRD